MSAFIGPALLKRLVAEKADVPEEIAERVLGAFNSCVLSALEAGGRVRALGIGYFEIKETKATRRLSPMVDGYVEVPAKRKIVFRESRGEAPRRRRYNVRRQVQRKARAKK